MWVYWITLSLLSFTLFFSFKKYFPRGIALRMSVATFILGLFYPMLEANLSFAQTFVCLSLLLLFLGTTISRSYPQEEISEAEHSPKSEPDATNVTTVPEELEQNPAMGGIIDREEPQQDPEGPEELPQAQEEPPVAVSQSANQGDEDHDFIAGVNSAPSEMLTDEVTPVDTPVDPHPTCEVEELVCPEETPPELVEIIHSDCVSTFDVETITEETASQLDVPETTIEKWATPDQEAVDFTPDEQQVFAEETSIEEMDSQEILSQEVISEPIDLELVAEHDDLSSIESENSDPEEPLIEANTLEDSPEDPADPTPTPEPIQENTPEEVLLAKLLLPEFADALAQEEIVSEEPEELVPFGQTLEQGIHQSPESTTDLVATPGEPVETPDAREDELATSEIAPLEANLAEGENAAASVAMSENPQSLLTRGLQLAKKKDHVQAVRYFNRVIACEPDTEVLYLAVSELSSLYQHLGYYPMASGIIGAFREHPKLKTHPGLEHLLQKMRFIDCLNTLLKRDHYGQIPYEEVPEALRREAFDNSLNTKHISFLNLR